VRPGIWSIPVPIPNNPLRYVLVYALETDKGPYIVDAGLSTAGFAIADVQGVLVTHIHPDHYGLAGRVREASGAWVALHPADARLLRARYVDPADLLAEMNRMLRRTGAPPEEITTLAEASMPVRAFVSPGEPDVLIEDGDKPEVPGWDLRAIWTPGHSPGHLCFYEPGNRLMLSGDHVLPRITPNIAFHPQAGANPLGDFLASLDKLRAFDTDEVLPAHEHRFTDLEGRLRELEAHHEARFAEAIVAIRSGATTSWEIAAHLTWSRPWDQIQGFMRRAAVGETMAHLYLLQQRGLMREVPGEPVTWELTPAAGAG
jgi:glyoxylase-like metal-dependent hydrolase (beta-lactamase superfamily II)